MILGSVLPHIPFVEFGKGDGTISSTPKSIMSEEVTLPSPSLLFGTVNFTTVYVSQFLFTVHYLSHIIIFAVGL